MIAKHEVYIITSKRGQVGDNIRIMPNNRPCGKTLGKLYPWKNPNHREEFLELLLGKTAPTQRESTSKLAILTFRFTKYKLYGMKQLSIQCTIL